MDKGIEPQDAFGQGGAITQDPSPPAIEPARYQWRGDVMKPRDHNDDKRTA